MVVFGAIGCRLLNLDGDVADAEFLAGNMLQAAKEYFPVSTVSRIDEDVGAEELVARCESPGVNVVD